MGPSSQENGQYNLLNSSSQFATGLGQNNLTQSSTFFSNLLSDPMKALAPEVSASQKQVGEANKTRAEFGTRSGGTAAAGEAANSTARGDIINLMGKTQTGAASELASTGSSLLSTGVQGEEAGFGEAKTIQGQKASQWSDLISSIASTAGGVVGGLPGNPGGAGDVLSNMLSGA
jgi:hypothetical protein